MLADTVSDAHSSSIVAMPYGDSRTVLIKIK
jgi:hypothetical protein